MIDIDVLESQIKKLSSLVVPWSKGVAQTPSIPIPQRWGSFDLLSVRGIDDLSFDKGEGASIIAFSDSELCDGGVATAIPTQIALERAFFHLSSPAFLSINPQSAPDKGSYLQVISSFPKEVPFSAKIPRSELPYLIGACELGFPKHVPSDSEIAKLYAKNQLFSAYYAARRARVTNDSRVGWFYELLAISFLGLPDEALALYEIYPHRGSAVPDVQLVNARYRALLKQHNEARTLLHALSFNEEFGGLAKKELARTFISTDEFDRAQDLLQGLGAESENDLDSMLLLALALRGIGYPTGDEATLRASLGLLEKVAQAGSFNSPEALFHSGVIFSRLGALVEAELVFRQSLFQRDRYATREALVRVLVSRGARVAAETELAALAGIRAEQASNLRVELCELIEALPLEKTIESDEHENANQVSSSTLGDGESGVNEEHAARELIARWGVPLSGTLADFSFLDAMINYFAPTGLFCKSLSLHFLRGRERGDVARAFSLCLAGALSRAGIVQTTSRDPKGQLVAQFTGSSAKIPLENFIADRISLGAGSDEASNLTALIDEGFDYRSFDELRKFIPEALPLSVERRGELEALSRGALAVVAKEGVELDLSLDALAAIDLFIDTHFDPGGEPKEDHLSDVDILQLLDGLGVHVGLIAGRCIENANWLDHPELQGIRIESDILGILYPVARLHTRTFFGDGIDPGARLSTLGLGLATSHLISKIKRGEVTSNDAGMRELTTTFLGFSSFSEEEIRGMVDGLLLAHAPRA